MKQFFKRKTILAGLIFTFIALLAFPSQAKAMTATDYQHCIDNTHDIESRKYVCNLCRDGRAVSTQGAAWINDDPNDSWKKDISIDGTAYENNGEITLYLRGGFYACGTNTVPRDANVYGYAAGIYTQELHQAQNNNLLLKGAVVSPVNNGSWMFYRGRGIEGIAYKWNDEIYNHLKNGGENKFEIKVKAKSFMQGSVSCGSDPKKGECREKSVYIFRCMHYLDVWQATNTCGTSTIKVRAYISYKKVTEDPGNKDTDFTDSAQAVCKNVGDSGPYYGNTLSSSKVTRYNYDSASKTSTVTGTASVPSSGTLDANGGENQIFLKPSDHVRFVHTLCFGVQGLKEASSHATYFTLKASGNNTNKFATQVINGRKITLDIGVKKPSQLKDESGTKIVSSLSNYAFAEASPHSGAGYTATPEDVGQKYIQSFSHNTLRGYVKWRSQKTGSCGCNTNTAKITYSENMTYRAATQVRRGFVWGYIKNYACTKGGNCDCKCTNGTAPDKCHAWSCSIMYRYRTDQTRTYTKKYENNTQITKKLTAYVPYNFTTKTYSRLVTTSASAGNVINFELGYQKKAKKTKAISNAAYATNLPATKEYRIITFSIPSGTESVDLTGNNNAAISGTANLCSVFNTTKEKCTVHGQPTDIAEDTNKHTVNYSYTIPASAEPGTKYCAAIAFYPSDSLNRGSGTAENLINIAMKGGSTWNVSDAVCNTVSRKPTFQVWNGGIYSPNISTSSSEHDDRTFGSWSEQLVVAGGSVSSFASGAAYGYSTGYNFGLPGGSTSSEIKNNSPLTIANSEDSVGDSGIVIDNNIIEQLKARFNVSSLPNTTGNLGVVNLPGDGSNVVVIRSAGTLTIDQNIFFSGDVNNPLSLISQDTAGQSFSSSAQLPQVLIFADNINIAGNVSRIDAWLIASGTIDTCSTKDSCNNHLIVNGPVFAKTLNLNRTAGEIGDGSHEDGITDPRSQNLTNDGIMTPAEVFNLRPDAYLWAYSQTGGFSDAATAYIRELAPRY